MATPDSSAALARTGATVADDIVRHVERLIVTGTLGGGDRLPAERTLAQDLGVSRAALREALGRLEAAGLVVRRHGSGSRVSREVPLSATLAARLAHADDDDDAEHSAEFREVVEPQIARLAAGRITADECAGLRELLVEPTEDDDPDQSIRRDVAFHVAVARASGNPLLSALGELTASWTVEARVHSHLEDEGRRISHDGHVRVLEALEARDGDAAAAAMATHLAQIRLVIEQVRGKTA